MKISDIHNYFQEIDIGRIYQVVNRSHARSPIFINTEIEKNADKIRRKLWDVGI